MPRMNDEQGKTPRVRRCARRFLQLSEHVLAIFGALTLVYWLCFDYSNVLSGSMSPTLQGNVRKYDSVLAEKVSYWFRVPRRWEVIAFYAEDGAQVMKRVVGLPGEKVQMLPKGRLFIDGKEVPPPAELGFLRYYAYGNLLNQKVVDCGEGYYVLGDDSRDSDDSRFNWPVKPNQIIGRAWIIVRPSERRGFVH
jgi:signal peptidase I